MGKDGQQIIANLVMAMLSVALLAEILIEIIKLFQMKAKGIWEYLTTGVEEDV